MLSGELKYYQKRTLRQVSLTLNVMCLVFVGGTSVMKEFIAMNKLSVYQNFTNWVEL